MDTDKPLHDQLRILGFFCISVTEAQSHQFNVGNRFERIISDAYKIIAQHVPEVVRNKLYQLGTEAQAEFRKAPYEQILSDRSRFPDTTGAKIAQDGSLNRPEKQQVEHDSPTRTLQPSKQTSAAVEGSSTETKRSPGDNKAPFSIAELESWADSAKSFLNPETIRIDDIGVFDYIKALDKSSKKIKIARRFALLRLWVSKEVWWPLPPQEFSRRLGAPSKVNLSRWLREGRTLFLLKANKGTEVLFSKLKSQNKLVELSPESKVLPHTNAEPNANEESYNDIELLLQSQLTEEAKEIVSSFDVQELELPRSCEDCITNSKLYRDAASSISKYLKEIHINRVFGGQTRLKHRLPVRENERPAKRWCQLFGPSIESPSNLGVIQYHFDKDLMHNDSQGLPYATESTTDVGSDGCHEVRGASTDVNIPVSGSPGGAGSQSGALVMPGSDSSLIATPPLEATAGEYERQPSTETTMSVRSIEADMEPVHLQSSTDRLSTHQLNEGYLNRPCADIVESLDDYRDNIPELSGVSFGIHETPSQALSAQPIHESSLHNWLHIDANSFNFDTAMFQPLGALEAMEFNDYQGELNAQ
ncbi:hypothetical protein F53441_12123 [Fusarium austroafricanum]|uniref:Uncharacterized protein n=1 Tax=Fusarium austroafricanum TaxID=2364996 RepID=A0A8H4JZY5_9HYPO|nr:hypothetical protein F53441_12123 [Fusarium austroafricanum]